MAALFGKDRFPPNYQAHVGMNTSELLHANSIELTNILVENEVLTPESKIFELGAGPARNLYYIREALQNYNLDNLKLYANDLFEKESLEHMHESIKNTLTFFEEDSEDMVNNHAISDIDLFLVSDHFMHLQYDKADSIIKGILSKWKPKYIMLREVKKEYETPDHPRLYHDYDQFLSDYDLVHESTSKQVNVGKKFAPRYFIWLLKRK